MFRVPITQEQKEYTARQLKTGSLGHRGTFDGSYRKQFIGLLAEVVVADILKVERPVVTHGFDHGIDFNLDGLYLDVKTMERKGDVRSHYVNNVVAAQLRYNTMIYLFTSLNTVGNLLTVCGLMGKHRLSLYDRVPANTTIKRDNGTSFQSTVESILVPMTDLIDVSCGADLHQCLRMYRDALLRKS
jgi:hypothetical protein